MDIVSGALGTVIVKLGKLLQAEYKLHKGLPEQIESLKHELESAQTALGKVGEVPPEQLDPQIRLWAREVRDASYDMEDILDTFLVEVATPADEKKDGQFKRLQKNIVDLFKKSKARHTITGAIEDMKKRLQEVANRLDRFSVPVALPAPPTKPDPRLADLHKEVEQLIGIDKAKAELMAMLILPTFHCNYGDSDVSGSSSRRMKIVSVVGVGGLGKTTLAKAVYADLKMQYDCRAFVSVGRNPDLLQVFINILFHLDRKEYEAIREVRSLQLLSGGLRKVLQNKRYFIVIDDVWDIITWKTIQSALDLKSTESRVITTTRNREVASSEEVYELCPLSRDNSKILFHTRLFGVKGECPANHLHEASEKILHKCGDVPLAIITMASLLAGKSREYWFEVCNSPGFYRGKGNQQVDDTEWILSLSYYDLPSHLRTCLLYLSVYPEDYEIDKYSLIWKWIAEGFVEKITGTGLFRQGEEHFNQLINRSMIQAVESKFDGRVYACRVHDMVLDLIHGLSGQENFVATSNDSEGTSTQNKVRRLAHHNRMMKQTQQEDHMGMAQVRSLVAYNCNIKSWVLHPGFKLLRVLDLKGCKVAHRGWQGLKHLGNLLHLRYLGLRKTSGIHELPEEIGKLKLLQTLDLERSDGIGVLPLGVCQLTQLVCLRGGIYTGVPDGFLTKVTSLEELHIGIDNLNDDSQRQFIKDVGKLSEVRVLEISGNFERGIMQSELAHSLGNLHKLQYLHVENNDYDVEAATNEWDRVMLPQNLVYLRFGGIRFYRVPSWISPAHLANLTYLVLLVEDMDEAGLRALGWLPELCFLQLTMSGLSMACITATVGSITAGDVFFQKLRFCRLIGCMVLLVVNEDATSVSCSIWNGQGAMAFIGSKTTMDECSRSVAPPPVMPNLQVLLFEVPVRALYEDGKAGCDNLGLECLPSLRKVRVLLACAGASSDDVEKAEAELRNGAQLHPNGPVIRVYQRRERSRRR